MDACGGGRLPGRVQVLVNEGLVDCPVAPHDLDPFGLLFLRTALCRRRASRQQMMEKVAMMDTHKARRGTARTSDRVWITKIGTQDSHGERNPDGASEESEGDVITLGPRDPSVLP